jgi:hypothetical protein
MRIASRFQRPGRSNDRRARASTAGVWLGLISLGCFFELEPVDLDGGIGGGGSGGSLGGAAGETPVGGDGGGGVAGIPPQDDCEQAGQKRCAGECVIASPSNGCGNADCAECASLPNAAPPTCGGDSGRCQITSCNPGFADCDADLAAYTGESASSNGCEYSFGTIEDSDPTQPLAAPRALITVDGSRDDWAVIPAYRLEETCVDCKDNVVVFQQPTAQNEPPPSSDLSAYFRVAWDGNSFYVLAEAFDDDVFDAGSSQNGCQTSTDGNYVPGPMCEDAFAVYFDGAAEAERNRSYGNVAHRILLGTSGVAFLPAQGQPPLGTIGVLAQQLNGPRCYRIEAQFPWTLLVSNQGQPVADKFPPAAGQTYGFDVAVSDWDPTVSEPTIVERQSQLFFTPRAPQSELHLSIAGVGSIVLTDHASSDVAGSPQ